MNSHRTTARPVGVLFITAAIAGILSVAISKPILDNPDYLAIIAENAARIMLAAFFELIMALACAGIAISLYPVLKKYNAVLALGAVCFRIIEAVFFTASALGLLSLLALSRDFVQAAAPDVAHFQAAGALLIAGRYWASQVFAAIAFCLGALMYYSILYQSRLIPRWLSGWGLVAIVLHLAAVVLTMFALITPFSAIQVTLALPILAQELVLAIWLIVKGFNPAAIASGSEKQL